MTCYVEVLHSDGVWFRYPWSRVRNLEEAQRYAELLRKGWEAIGVVREYRIVEEQA